MKITFNDNDTQICIIELGGRQISESDASDLGQHLARDL